MPKAILEFNLPEERDIHRDALEGTALRGALQDFDNYLRGRLKHEDLSDEVYKALSEAREHLHDQGVEIWA